LLGITTGRVAKFVKQYTHVHDEMVGGVRRYVEEVRTRHFPEPDHVYSVEPAELAELRRYLEQEPQLGQGVGLGAAYLVSGRWSPAGDQSPSHQRGLARLRPLTVAVISLPAAPPT
jgi:Ketopantoate hydroxymethyltransferase